MRYLLKALAMAMLASTMTMGIMMTAEPSVCTMSTKVTVLLSREALKGGGARRGRPGSTRPAVHIDNVILVLRVSTNVEPQINYIFSVSQIVCVSQNFILNYTELRIYNFVTMEIQNRLVGTRSVCALFT